jgi:hypothetical protein
MCSPAPVSTFRRKSENNSSERSDPFRECSLQPRLIRQLVQLNNFTNISPIRFGLAFPLESFMTCPFRKLMAAALPAL